MTVLLCILGAAAFVMIGGVGFILATSASKRARELEQMRRGE